MASSTMINLRNIQPLASSAAVLPGHVLRFNIPGIPGIEPSSASVEPVDKKSGSILTNEDDDDDAMLLLDAIENEEHVVHGVLYKLSEDDFATICRTEGVPFAYSLHRCRVIPYVNDDGTSGSAGRDALQRAADALGSIEKEEEEDNDEYNGQQLKPSTKEQMTMTTATTKAATTTSNKSRWGVQTFTLRAARKEWRQNQKDIPPSQSYINVLLRGANEFALDDSYIRKLENDIPVGKTWFGNGFAENLLRIAEQRRQIR